MIVTAKNIPVTGNFNFWRTVFSHGWCSLPPFRVDRQQEQLHRVLTLDDGLIIDSVLSPGRTMLSLELKSRGRLTSSHVRSAVARLQDCLRLNEDFAPFYREARRHTQFRWISRTGSGRLLRAPTVFEDIVKMICTTNCSWSLTERIIHNLLECTGGVSPSGERSFPAPEAIAALSEQTMRKEIRSGYRSPYLLEFSERVASGTLDVEGWRISELPTSELFDQVRSIKGVGEYAAGNILKLLGRYDYLGLDSWVRGRYYELFTNGRVVDDSRIGRQYAKYGEWRGLLFWLEMTKHWYGNKFPF